MNVPIPRPSPHLHSSTQAGKLGSLPSQSDMAHIWQSKRPSSEGSDFIRGPDGGNFLYFMRESLVGLDF